MFATFYAHGAAAAAAVSVKRLLPLMSDRRKARLFALSPQAEDAFAVMTVFPYFADKEPGNIALFARGYDYLEAIFKRLSQAAASLPFPALALKNCYPLPAVAAARLSGLAFTGRHGLAVCPPYGSFFALGAVLCQTELPEGNDAGFCEDCGLCAAACPTGALDQNAAFSSLTSPPSVLSRDKCLSHITQRKGDLTDEQRIFLAKSPYVWGCDLCQLACPHNRRPARTTLPEFLTERVHSLTPGFDAKPLENRHFTGRGTEVLRRNLSIMGHNAE